MPTYQYACTTCGEQLEVVQTFSDDPLTICPACGGALRKVYSAVGIVFKGSGFYRTDSRAEAKSKSSNGSSDGSGSAGDSGSSSTDSKPTADSAKPAAGTPSKPSATTGS